MEYSAHQNMSSLSNETNQYAVISRNISSAIEWLIIILAIGGVIGNGMSFYVFTTLSMTTNTMLLMILAVVDAVGGLLTNLQYGVNARLDGAEFILHACSDRRVCLDENVTDMMGAVQLVLNPIACKCIHSASLGGGGC